jgi:glycosyltransferase involved in cell wall biosynthesis
MKFKKPEVILTCNYSPWSAYSGGAQKSVHMVATEMVRQGISVIVVYSKAPWENISVPVDLPYPIHWTWFWALKPGISSPLRFLNGISFFFTVRALSSENTVLHGNGDEASLYWLIRAKRRFVFTNRYPEFPAFLSGALWSKATTWLRILFREPRFVAIALAMRNANRVTVTSSYSLEEVGRCFGMLAQVVPNGVDPVFLETPLKVGIQTGVLFFGRLTRAKGSDLVLEAYALLSQETRLLHPLLIVGKGPLQVELEERARALGIAVNFIGWKAGTDLAQEIFARKVICLPSREESFGNTVVETLALGQTLVSSQAGSIPEVVGRWGTLVAGENPIDLARALESELRRNRPVAEMECQREFIRSKYSWAGTVTRFREIYAD